MMMSLRRVFFAVVSLSLVIEPLYAGIAIDVPPDGLSSSVMTKGPISGTANCTTQFTTYRSSYVNVTVKYKPPGGFVTTKATAATIARSNSSSQSTGNWSVSVTDTTSTGGYWTASGLYLYLATNFEVPASTSTTNTCTIP